MIILWCGDLVYQQMKNKKLRVAERVTKRIMVGVTRRDRMTNSDLREKIMSTRHVLQNGHGLDTSPEDMTTDGHTKLQTGLQEHRSEGEADKEKVERRDH